MPIDEFVAALADWGYVVKPRYFKHIESERDTCHLCDFAGTFGQAVVEIMVTPRDGGLFDLFCLCNGRIAACFKLWPHHHGWRLEYWSHWGHWFRDNEIPDLTPQRYKIMVQWGVR